ncbi:hypothetical protein [Shewanella algae]|uniref:hypothetical protein n=1 Tax=Shewanella algae TaxID=38313 RepID=UPI001AAC9B81|nr:hypothetical protein [Shewanella algae]MBO2599886.1 hypothetical protein [Shewanella algae]
MQDQIMESEKGSAYLGNNAPRRSRNPRWFMKQIGYTQDSPNASMHNGQLAFLGSRS